MISKARARHLRRMIEANAETMTDERALEAVELFPRWVSDTIYAVDERISYEGTLYKCLQMHTSQPDWTPDKAVSLWVRVTIEEWPEWVQPTGATDAYELGAKVSHNEKHWISDIPANVYEPGVYGWSEAE